MSSDSDDSYCYYYSSSDDGCCDLEEEKRHGCGGCQRFFSSCEEECTKIGTTGDTPTNDQCHPPSTNQNSASCQTNQCPPSQCTAMVACPATNNDQCNPRPNKRQCPTPNECNVPTAENGFGNNQPATQPAMDTNRISRKGPPKELQLPEDALFTDIGLNEEEFGIQPFPTTDPDPNFLKENEYEDESEVWFSKPSNENEPISSPQYTPASSLYPTSSKQMIDSLTAESQLQSQVTSQDPDGIGWLAGDWPPPWDGIPLDPTGLTKEQICAWITPGSVWTVKGLRERFYEVNPFVDITAPTLNEIDNWNLEVIRHFRKLLGNTTPVTNNARLFLESRWASERKHTEVWDATYPPTGSYGNAWGPCWNPPGSSIDIAGGHCGEAFYPNATDRSTYIGAEPYNNDYTTYPELSPYTNRYAQASGLSGTNADIPWSIRLSVVIRNWICAERLTGHPGPYVGPTSAREEFGCDWWYEGGSWTNFRGKWR